MATVDKIRSYEMGGKIESFANWVSNISPTETPFVSLTGKKQITNTLYQWQTDRLNKASTSNHAVEGALAPTAVLNNTETKSNVTQILNKVVTLTDTAQAIKSHGRGEEAGYHIGKAVAELKRDLEATLLSKQVRVDGNATTPRQLAAFVAQVADLNVADPDTGAIVHKELTGGKLTEAALFDLTYNLYLAGSDANIIMFHPKHATVFSGLMETGNGRVRMFDGQETKFNKYVGTIVDQMGVEYKLIPNRQAQDDVIYFFNSKDWTQTVLRAPERQPLAKTGSSDSWLIEMEVGLEHANPYASGVLVIKP